MEGANGEGGSILDSPDGKFPCRRPFKARAGKQSGSRGPGLLCTGCVSWGRSLLGSSSLPICQVGMTLPWGVGLKGLCRFSECKVLAWKPSLFFTRFMKALTLELGWRQQPARPVSCSPGAETWKKGEKGPLEPQDTESCQGHTMSSPCLSKFQVQVLRHLQHNQSLSPTQGWFRSAPRLKPPNGLHPYQALLLPLTPA